MTRFSAFIIIASMVFAARAHAEPIGVGIALSDGIVVYAEPSVTATPIDTLNFGDYRLAIGVLDGEVRVFDQNGWTQVEDDGGTVGWVGFTDVAITSLMLIRIDPADSVFSRPRPIVTIDALDDHPGFREVIREVNERVSLDGRFFYTIQHSRWMYLADSTVVQTGDAYYKLINYFTDSAFFNDESFINLQPRQDFDTALRVADRLEQVVLLDDILYLHRTPSRRGFKAAVGAGAAIADVKARIHLLRNDRDLAIQELERILSIYDTQPLYQSLAGVDARFQLADIYFSGLMDTTNAMEQLHGIIQTYPDEPIDVIDRADDRAARVIVYLMKHNADLLAAESDRILSETSVPNVRLVGYRGKVRSLGLMGQTDEMISTALDALAEHPGVSFRGIDYGSNIVSTVLVILRPARDHPRILNFLEDVRNRYPEDVVGAAAALRAAQEMERTNGNLSTIQGLYRRVVDEHPGFQTGDDVLGDRLWDILAELRLKELKEAGLNTVEIIDAETPMTVGLEDDTVFRTLLPGTHARVLYSAASLNRTIQNVPDLAMTKVELQTGQAGWVPNERIRPVNKPLLLDPEASSVWTAPLANGANNLRFEGEAIDNPVATGLLNGYILPFGGIRFIDVNEDNTLDLIMPDTRSDQLFVIDGNTQDEITRIPNPGNNFTTLGDGLLFRKRRIWADGQIVDSLYAHNPASGSLVWSLSTAESRNPTPLYHDGRVYTFPGDSLAHAYDSSTGQFLWSRSLGAEINSYQGSAIEGQTLVVTEDFGPVHALDTETGATLWRLDDARALEVAVIDDGVVYLIEFISRIHLTARSLQDGTLLWQQELEGGFAAQNRPVVTDRHVFLNTGTELYGFDKSDGSRLWFRFDVGRMSYLMAIGPRIYAVSQSFSSSQVVMLFAMDQETGETVWRHELTGPTTQPVYQSGQIFVRGRSGIVVLSDSTAFAQIATPPEPFQLLQNYPNPFNNRTQISFSLEQASHVRLIIYNILGQRIRSLMDDFRHQGFYTVGWDGRNDDGRPVSSGVYLYRLETASGATARRMIFLK